MENFTYYNPAKIIFGKDSILQLEEEFKKHKVTSLLMLYSGDYITSLGIQDQVHKICKDLKIQCFENGNITPNPKIELIRDLITFSRIHEIDFILAVGGGSVIDSAKTVSIGIPYEYDVWDFFTKNITPVENIPVGVVSTIPASGSESSNAAIISNGLRKLGIEFDCLIPAFAILDPQYTKTLPAYQTACGCADILSHLMERYLSNSLYVDTTDYMIEGAIIALMKNAKILLESPQDIHARSEIQCLGFIAHNNLLDSGRIADWGAHRIEHELSASYGITHGEGMSIVMIAILKYYAIHNPHKLIQLYDRLWFNEIDSKISLAEKCSLVVQKFYDFFDSLGLKTNLKQFNIGCEEFENMSTRATEHDKYTVGHYVPLNAQKILEVLQLCL